MIDARGHVIMPGLINGHRHLLGAPTGALAKGARRWRTCTRSSIQPSQPLVPTTPTGTRCGFGAEMIRNGTTTFQEPGCTHVA